VKPTINLRLPFKLARTFPAPLWTGVLQNTPIGEISFGVSTRGLALLAFANLAEVEAALGSSLSTPQSAPRDLLDEVIKQVSEYLQGRRRIFDLPLDTSSLNPFEARVHRLTIAIPFGEVRTYGDIAAELGSHNGSRAVGGAQARNPLPLFIPCHRVVGTDRKLHGFAAPEGIRTKAWLLQLEGHTINNWKIELPGVPQQLPLI
jgi:methylated-DNA-[protein]-cysteine S-methyltransferase